ncbi:MAG TPA: hypothetical protein VFY71_12050, partial [Planctomycetota bacterium]|nr:hypothetical protein [Planctomycetota bacterium]
MKQIVEALSAWLAATPRLTSRGPIEAAACCSSWARTSRPLRGSRAAAPLKPDIEPESDLAP